MAVAATTTTREQKTGRQMEKADRWLAHPRANEKQRVSRMGRRLGEAGEAVDVDFALHKQGQPASGWLETVNSPALARTGPRNHFPVTKKI